MKREEKKQILICDFIIALEIPDQNEAKREREAQKGKIAHVTLLNVVYVLLSVLSAYLFLAPRSPPFTLATPFFNSFFRVHINLSINCVADVSESIFCLKSWREKTAKTLLLTSCVRIIQEFIIKYTEYLWGFASFCSLVHLVDCSALLFDCCSTFIEILTNETNEKKQHEKSVDDKRVDRDTKWGEKSKKSFDICCLLATWPERTHTHSQWTRPRSNHNS